MLQKIANSSKFKWFSSDKINLKFPKPNILKSLMGREKRILQKPNSRQVKNENFNGHTDTQKVSLSENPLDAVNVGFYK